MHMDEKLPRGNNTNTVDQIKAIVSKSIQILTESELPPMIGGLVLIAEYTEESGDLRYVSYTSDELSAWTEIGLLETRLTTAKRKWATDPIGPDSD